MSSQSPEEANSAHYGPFGQADPSGRIHVHGVKAALFDGLSARQAEVRVRLNISSLSNKVMLEMADPDDGHVVTTLPLKQLKVLTPLNIAKRRTKGELWLSAKHWQLRVRDYFARQEILHWLRRVSGRRAWRHHNPIAPVLLAMAVSVGLGFLIDASALRFARVADANGQLTAALSQPQSGAVPGLSRFLGPDQKLCRNIEAVSILNSAAAVLAPQIEPAVFVVQQTRPDQAQSLRSPRVLRDGTILIDQSLLKQGGSPDIAAAVLAHSLVLSFRKSQPRQQSAEARRFFATQILTGRVLPHALWLGMMHSANRFDTRRLMEVADERALAVLTQLDVEASGLVSYFDQLVQDAARRQSPQLRFLSPQPDPTERLVRTRVRYELAAFRPGTLPSLFSDQDWRILNQACA